MPKPRGGVTPREGPTFLDYDKQAEAPRARPLAPLAAFAARRRVGQRAAPPHAGQGTAAHGRCQSCTAVGTLVCACLLQEVVTWHGPAWALG